MNTIADKQTILIVDDDYEIAELIELYLASEGYTILKAHDGKECLDILKEKSVSLVVLDIMMPELDGISVCKKLRETTNIPVILLTAKTRHLEKIQGLTAGADDYVCKPFQPAELVARIKAQLRRFTELNPGYNASEKIIVKDLIIDPQEHTVTKGNKNYHLSPKEFDILLLLAQNRGRVFNSEMIFEQVWKEEAFEQENTVMVHIRKIRSKLDDDARKPKYIHTVWGVGYKIEK